MDTIKTYVEKLNAAIEQYPAVNNVLLDLEKKTNVKKIFIVYGISAFVVLWLMFGYGAQLLCSAIGFVYPAYCSIKAIESRNKDDDTQWLTYWVVFANFSVFEFFSDAICDIIPFYWLMKCVFLLWCMSPLNGSTLIYQTVILPFFKKNQGSIDNALNRGKELAGGAFAKAKEVLDEKKAD
jgi:receptor expression-enhancing protein 5/6